MALIGRGTGKSPIQAKRSRDAIVGMPGSSIASIGPSYVNIMERTLPPMEQFWQQFFGWREWDGEGGDYLKFRKPPDHWPQPTTPPSSYKHAISTRWGTILYLGSLDRPGILNSLSLQYYGLDEGRFADYERITKDLTPAVRGDLLKFGNSPLYRGRTITSDLPYVEDNADWMYELQSKMNPKAVQLILQFQDKIDKRRMQWLEATTKQRRLALEKKIAELEYMADQVRKQTTYFRMASNLVNRHVLGLDYFRENSDPRVNPKHVFRTSYLSIRPRSVESMFYGKMTERHWYMGDFNYSALDSLYEKYGTRANLFRNSSTDLDVDTSMGLVAGLDFGNMVSMSIGQKNPFGRSEFRTVNFLYALVPDDMDNVVDKFCQYYEPHPTKTLRLHYDRTGNIKLENSKQTKAEHFASRLRAKGWNVSLMSIGMGIIPHPLKHLLFSRMFAEEELERFPILRTNKQNCKELYASLNLAPAIPKGDDIFKDKRSEKLAIHRLPMESTNPSDSWDYMIWGEYHHHIDKRGVPVAWRPKTSSKKQ